MRIRTFLVGLLALVLVLWGPLPRGWLAAVVLIGAPAVAWFALAWIWRVWQPDAIAEDRLTRTIAGAIAGALFVGAAITAQDKYHFDCTEWEQTGDGRECVGEWVRVPGPDLGAALMLVLAGGFIAFWFGIHAAAANEKADEGRASPSSNEPA